MAAVKCKAAASKKLSAALGHIWLPLALPFSDPYADALISFPVTMHEENISTERPRNVRLTHDESARSPALLAALIIDSAEKRYREFGDVDAVLKEVHAHRASTADSRSMAELDHHLIDQLVTLYLESDDDW